MTLAPYDLGMIATHVGLGLGLWKLWREQRRERDAAVRRHNLAEYRLRLMWQAFCKEHNIEGRVNGTHDDAGDDAGEISS